jgi:hypothetical protein
MYEGKITGFRDPDVPAAELGRLMAGGADAETGATAADVAPVPGAETLLGAATVPDVAEAAAPAETPETPETPEATAPQEEA